MNGQHQAKFRDPVLIDFGVDASGHGRRLELLGGVLVDRPLPQARDPRRQPARWRDAGAVYRPAPATPAPRHDPSSRGCWEFPAAVPDPWRVCLPAGSITLSLEVHPAPSGQVGVFLEQAPQWDWLARTTPRGARMLSLFAHSGAATLAMAAAGAEVVHVDASRQAVGLARRNAEASGLAAAPVRWVCEDAATFVARELRRGMRFSGVVLDPPSWGHGPRGQAFAIDRDLGPLVDDVARLLNTDGTLPAGPLLLTCHSPGWPHRRLRQTLLDACRGAGHSVGSAEAGPLHCTDETGRSIELGAYARLDRTAPLPSRPTGPPL
jgi:23S rRNA (cytosine1962-C5)-methyltransferase